MDNIAQYLEIATFVITILGVPAALYIYVKEQRLQRKEREYGTFDALDNKYIEIQQLCLEYPNLDIFDTPFESPSPLSEQEKKQEEAIILIRISIFERAFLMYQKEHSRIKSEQWEGWELEIEEWLERANFKAIWEGQKQYFDKQFSDYFSKNNA